LVCIIAAGIAEIGGLETFNIGSGMTHERLMVRSSRLLKRGMVGQKVK